MADRDKPGNQSILGRLTRGGFLGRSQAAGKSSKWGERRIHTWGAGQMQMTVL